ncbi:MAG: hypothetical protein KH333_10175 [Clostridium sp.]|nr:hypothetical protein [Clostridium sp.]
MENIIAILGLIITPIAALLTYFNKRDLNLEKKYDDYSDFLLELFELLKIIPNLDLISHISKDKFKKTFIPPYIFYLCDKGKKKKLKKILKVDYILYYKNMTNNIHRGSNWVYRLFYFFYYLIGLFLPAASVIFALYKFYSTIYGHGYSLFIVVFSYIIFFLISFISAIIILYIITKSVKHACYLLDTYTTNKLFIKKIIKSKLKKYDKNKSTYYI